MLFLTKGILPCQNIAQRTKETTGGSAHRVNTLKLLNWVLKHDVNKLIFCSIVCISQQLRYDVRKLTFCSCLHFTIINCANAQKLLQVDRRLPDTTQLLTTSNFIGPWY